MKISLDGFNNKSATLVAAAGTEKGDIVSLSNNLTVSTASQGAAFCGVCEDVRDGYATVLLEGYTRVSYSSTAPSLGFAVLAADGSGGVKTAQSGRTCLVVEVDTVSNTIGIIM